METTSLGAVLRPPKSAKIDWSTCLCHVRHDSSGVLTPFSDRSWKTLWRSAAIRQDSILAFLRDNGDPDVPRGGYHRQCYQTYTCKSHLDPLIRRNVANTTTDADNEAALKAERYEESCDEETVRTDRHQQVTRATRSQVVQTDVSLCLFCQKQQIKIKGKRQNLSACMSFDACSAIFNAAQTRDDERILLEVQSGPDLIAKEICYHRSCYADYTHIKTLRAMCEGHVSKESEVYDRVFACLAADVQAKILDNPAAGHVVRVTELTRQYTALLATEGVHVTSYRNDYLKHRLVRHFGDRLVFFRNSKKVTEPELITAAAVPQRVLLECAAKTLPPARNHDSTDSDSDPADDMDVDQVQSCSNVIPTTVIREDLELYHSALLLRAAILSMKNTIPSVPNAEDLAKEEGVIPDVLYNFLSWLLCGDCGDSGISLDSKAVLDDFGKHSRVMSLGQDIVHTVSDGRLRTPKHFVLPLTIQHLTRSEQLVTIVNRYGHGYSSSRLAEYETALAERFLEQAGPDGVFIPSNINAMSSAVFCWDNNDLCEDTASGSGSTHCTNGIIIQRENRVNQPRPQQSRTKTARHRRSIQVPPPQELNYIAGARIGPPRRYTYTEVDLSMKKALKNATHFDTAWMILRSSTNDSQRLGQVLDAATSTGQAVAPWSGFNAAVGKAAVKSSIGYLPVLPSSPTELSTVYELMRRSCMIAKKLNQPHVIITLDQAVYSLAQEIRWKHPGEFEEVVLRMGSFHICMTFLAILGKRFGDGGLQDVLVESGTVAPGSVAAVLDGRHYNRGVRAHKIVWEALSRLRWQQFESSLDASPGHSSVNFGRIRRLLGELRASPDKDKLTSLQALPDFKKLMVEYDNFCSQDKGPLFAFWSSYLTMVELLLAFIRATREGDWELHCSCVRLMLPWMFSYDRINYARYMTIYCCEMFKLKESHPAAYEELKSGAFSVQRTADAVFAQVPVDQAIEQSFNRDTKVKGGIVGFSLKPGAVQRWVITAHERASIARLCKLTAGLEQTADEHKQLGHTAVQRSERDVQAVMALLQSWQNPFGSSDVLLNIASGVAARKEVEKDLLSAGEQGERALEGFINCRLKTLDPEDGQASIGFFDTLHKMKLRTFGAMMKESSVKVNKTKVVLKADRNLFARMIVMAQSRLLNIREVLTYELGPLPWSLATADGSPCKTQKSTLLNILERGHEPADDVPLNTAFIVDAMAVLQSLSSPAATFGGVAEQIFHVLAANLRGPGARVDFVIDQYQAQTIKASERQRRGAERGSIRVHIQSSSQKLPIQWKKFLSNSSNKKDFLHFLAAEWPTQEYVAAALHGDRSLYVTDGMNCHRLASMQAPGSSVSSVIAEPVHALLCSHEEADTRLILHAAHAATAGHRVVVIRSPDTDVAVLAVAHSWQIPEARLLFLTGAKHRRRYVDVSVIARKLGKPFCQALPGFHALTGCDTTSAFCGKGKAAAFQLVMSSDAYQNTLQTLGSAFAPTDQLLSACERLVCAIYGYDSDDVNEVRYALFCAKAAESSQLPPTRDALRLHVRRANYQAGIWQRALESQPTLPHPTGHGWTADGEDLVIQWTTLPPAPRDVLLLLSCQCRTGCTSGRCSCHHASLPCTDVCNCENCQNTALPVSVSEPTDGAQDSDAEA